VSLPPYRLTLTWPEVLAAAAALSALAAWLDLRAGGGLGGAALRALGVLLIGAALSRPALDRGSPEQAVVLVDRSTSVADGAVDAALDDLRRLESDRRVLAFGSASGSPLGAALDAAARALPGGGRVVVVSDGQATDGGAVAAAARAREAGVRVDALAVPARGGPDAAVTAIEAPGAVRAGEVVALSVGLRASAAVTGALTVWADERVVHRAAAAVGPAGTSVAVRYPAVAPGDMRLRAAIRAVGDAEAGNDTAFAAVHVAPPARVLVAGDGVEAVGLADALGRRGLAVTVLGPGRLPSRLSQLEAWDALVLVDTPAAAMGSDQLAAVEAFVADLGRGVVLTGGPQSFLPGGWENTPLADLAPLSLDPPPREERDPVALVLMIDQSASMGSVEGRGAISKLDLAREAAILAVEVLHQGDQIGVVMYDDTARWLVPLATVGAGRALAEIEQALAGLSTGGGTRILSGLELGLPALAVRAEVETRHAVLLSDGRDFNPDAAAYDAAIQAARAAGVTLSTIAIGADADRELLARLARLGRGRYHSAAEPADLPRLAVAESEIVRARSEQSGSFRAELPPGGPHPALAGVSLEALPELTGYLAMRPREGAEVALQAPGGDPLVAVWNYGAGRVVAWTSDAGASWAARWAESAGAAAFWSRLVHHVARAPDAGPPGVDVTWPAPGRARVEVDALDRSGRTVDLAEASLVITDAHEVRIVPLPQTGPGRYAAEVALPTPGAYPAAVAVASAGDGAGSGTGAEGAAANPPGEGASRGAGSIDGAAGTRRIPVPLAWSYPDEMRPARSGAALLAAVAAAGGGRVLDRAADLPPTAAPAERIPLWPWLLGAAAVLWVGDVARQMGVGWRRGGRL